jgi:sugar phosphate isomerase/epimerase
MSGRLRFAYGTNGFTSHRLDDALAVIAGLGYDGVALTLDANHLDPFAPDLGRRVAAVATRLDELGLAVVVETGGRYVLDPWRKHEPSLVSGEPGPRISVLGLAMAVAADLGAEVVSLWSGARSPEADPATAWQRLVAATATVVAEAERRGVTLGFEPEPGMVVETVADARRLSAALGDPPRLRLTLDIGHCRCVELDASAVPDVEREAEAGRIAEGGREAPRVGDGLDDHAGLGLEAEGDPTTLGLGDDGRAGDHEALPRRRRVGVR